MVTIDEGRKIIESAWEWSQIRLAEPFEGCSEGKWVARLPGLPLSDYCFDTEAEAILAALGFTKGRQKQIKVLDEDIAWVAAHGHIGVCKLSCCNTRNRIVACLQTARAEIAQGMVAEGGK